MDPATVVQPHAIRVRDHASGEDLDVLIPSEHADHWLGWGDADRIWWQHDGAWKCGVARGRGRHGISVVDDEGQTHRLDHGSYHVRAYRPSGKRGPLLPVERMVKAIAWLLEPLRKADHPAPPPGSRWITVHPWGEGNPGVPILLEPVKGTKHYRVIGGAGGKLDHLILKHVGEKKADPEKDKERRAKNAAERKKRIESERALQSGELETKRREKRIAEEAFLKRVRETVGGVEEPLDTKDLSPEAANIRLAQHHALMMRQAIRAIRAKRDELIVTMPPDTDDAAKQALAFAVEDLELDRADQIDAATRRHTGGRSRSTASPVKVGGDKLDVFKEQAEQLDQAPPEDWNPAAKQQAEDAQLIGRAAAGLAKIADGEQPTPSERRAVEQVIATTSLPIAPMDLAALDRIGAGDVPRHAGGGDDREDDFEAAEEHRLDIQDAARDAAALLVRRYAARDAAALLVRRYDAKRERAEKLAGMDEADAVAAYTRAQVMTAAHREAKLHRQERAQPEDLEVKDHDVAEFVSVMADYHKIRQIRKEFKGFVDDLMESDYDRSRKGWSLPESEVNPTEAAIADLYDAVRTQRNHLLAGLLDPASVETASAMSDGAYQAMSDAALSIGGTKYLDRGVVDALGLPAASILLRHALERDGHDPAAILSAMEKFHVDKVESDTRAVLDEVRALLPGALGEGLEDGEGLAKASAMLDHGADKLAQAEGAVGSALGQFEARAALAQAFRGDLPDEIEINVPRSESTDLLLQGFGLDRSKYNYSEKSYRIPRQAWDALVSKEAPELTAMRRETDAIRRGERDEPGWLPKGIIARDKATFQPPADSAPTRLYRPVDMERAARGGDDMRAAIREHAASRIAEGEDPWKVRADLVSPSYLAAQGEDPGPWIEAVGAELPLMESRTIDDPDNVAGDKAQVTMSPKGAAEVSRWAEDYTKEWAASQGAGAEGLYDQRLPEDQGTTEAVYRAVMEHPQASVAFADPDRIGPKEQRILRDYYAKEHAGTAAKDRAAYDMEIAALGPEPSRESPERQFGLFSGAADTDDPPEWIEWHKRHDEIHEKYADALDASRSWGEYARLMGGNRAAYAAMQERMKGEVLSAAQDRIAEVTKRNLFSAAADLPHADQHVVATGTMAEREEFRVRRSALDAKVRNRIIGRFAGEEEGEVVRRRMAAIAQANAESKQQVGMFGSAPKRPEAPKYERPKPGPGQRLSLGPVVDQQIARMVQGLAHVIKPGSEPVKAFPGLNMDGPRVLQQRAVKQWRNQDRLGLVLGTGTGKTLISIGGLTDAMEAGKIKKGVIITPASVVEQQPGEVMQFTEPGKYPSATSSGLSYDERLDQLRNPTTKLHIWGHEAWRDTANRVLAEHLGTGTERAIQRALHAPVKERAKMYREAFQAKGIDLGELGFYGDEAHAFTRRGGAETSALHVAVTGTTHPDNIRFSSFGSATPVKNDPTELQSFMSLVNPDLYGDPEKFHRDYGRRIERAPDAVRRDLAGWLIQGKVDPEGVKLDRQANPTIGEDGRKVPGQPLELSPWQQERMSKIDAAYTRATEARARGEVDVEAIAELHPERFKDLTDPGEREQAAERISRFLGATKRNAHAATINAAPFEHNPKAQRLVDTVVREVKEGKWRHRDGTTHTGKPAVVFAESPGQLAMLAEQMQRRGVRAEVLEGATPMNKRQELRQRLGKDLDVLLLTRAGEAGLNLQAAKVLHHYDVPVTAKSWTQRTGRAFRQKQLGDVEVHDWYANHPVELRAMDRLGYKSRLGEVTETDLGPLDEHGLAGYYSRALAEKHGGPADSTLDP